MTGRFFIGKNSYLQIEDINKNTMFCSLNSLFDYQVIGDVDNPTAIDPSGGPFIKSGNFHINEWNLKNIKWDDEKSIYLLEFKR